MTMVHSAEPAPAAEPAGQHPAVAGVARLLAEYTPDRASVNEEVLSRSYSGRQTPYQWLARAVSNRASLVCDLACGPGRMCRELAAAGRTVIGVDTSRTELQQAQRSSAGPWVQASVARLPFATGSLDAVTTAMGLIEFSPLPDALAEIARALRPGGVFAAIAPTFRPLGPTDLRILGRLSGMLRTPPRLTGSLEITVGPLLNAAGLTRAEDRRERYTFEVTERDDARRLLEALFPGASAAERLPAAIEYLMSPVDGAPVRLPVPIRRIVAVK